MTNFMTNSMTLKKCLFLFLALALLILHIHKNLLICYNFRSSPEQ